MPKVLIISSPFYGYERSVGRAFEQLGYQVQIENYDEPIHPFKGWLRWQHKFSFNRERLREQSRQKYKVYIERVFDEFKPDIVFSYNGTILKDEPEVLSFALLKDTERPFWLFSYKESLRFLQMYPYMLVLSPEQNGKMSEATRGAGFVLL